MQSLIANIYISAGQTQGFPCLVAQKNEGGLHYSFEITLPKVKVFSSKDRLGKKTPNNIIKPQQ